jgi:hypothetical protein
VRSKALNSDGCVPCKQAAGNEPLPPSLVRHHCLHSNPCWGFGAADGVAVLTYYIPALNRYGELVAREKGMIGLKLDTGVVWFWALDIVPRETV